MNEELVSCTVLSYNSSATIVETLNSIKAQTYHNIELIVSDDCSKDDTLEVCRDWIRLNKDRFVRVELLTVDKNSGVCANGNRARKACKGEWIKGIAADDILTDDCIENNMNFVREHPETSFIASCMSIYNKSFTPDNCIENKRNPWNVDVYTQPREVQLRKMAFCSYVYAPATFYRKSLFENVGGFNTQYGYEDWPFYIRVLEYGYRIDYMDKVTVCYRIHQSLSHDKGKLFNYKLSQKTRRFVKEKCNKYYTWKQYLATNILYYVESIMFFLHLDKDTAITRFVYEKITNFTLRLGWFSIR